VTRLFDEGGLARGGQIRQLEKLFDVFLGDAVEDGGGHGHALAQVVRQFQDLLPR